MAQASPCPICGKRKPERFCPAKGEKICAICCGTEREVTLDCPADCPYLVAAHRYEKEHAKPLTEEQVPFPETSFSTEAIYARQPLLNGFCQTIVNFAGTERDLTDQQIITAIGALAQTYRTLVSGIYYEKPPAAHPAQELYAALGNFIQEFRKQESSAAGFTALKDSEVFHVLVFLSRIAVHGTNQRPRARLFLESLRAQFPEAVAARAEASRIIIP